MKKIVLFIVLALGINSMAKSQENNSTEISEMAYAGNTTLSIENNTISLENIVTTDYPFDIKKNPKPHKNKNRQATKYIIIAAAVVVAIVAYTLIANARIEQR